MPDHIHCLITAEMVEDMRRFVQDYTSKFALDYNRTLGRNGAVFKAYFGWAQKKGGKAVRTCIAYILNNPVERFHCKSAIQARWNFLAYARSPFPFSKAEALRNPPRILRRKLDEVKARRTLLLPIGYQMMDRLIGNLPDNLAKLFADYLIQAYNVSDFEKLSSFFHSTESMIAAIDSNTGTEYDLHEPTRKGDDRFFFRMIRSVSCLMPGKTARQVQTMSNEEKVMLANYFVERMAIPASYIKSFLHWNK